MEAPKPAAVKVEFIPEPAAAAGIARQIKASGRAYPLFGTARMFLDRPERHRVRLTSLDANQPLYQIGDGPISTDRATIERNAFRTFKAEYYREDVVQGEAPKGNFTNVARLRGGGLLIGPTNHHNYQPTLRKIYEERFSRRMSFAEFQSREIEILSDEQAINDWKEQARTTTTYVTLKEPEPLTFKSAIEAELHFRKHYLPGLVNSGMCFETNGVPARSSGDRSINASIREALEKERPFPVSVVNQLRPVFTDAGLHFFKHRKRILFISPVRPQRHPVGQEFKPQIAAILKAIEESPKLTRHDLAVKLLGEGAEGEGAAERKTQLAADLHYLIHAGFVIEFHDNTLDLPLPPKSAQAGDAQAAPKSGAEAAPEAAAKSSPAESTEAPATAVIAGPDVLATAELLTSATPVAESQPAEGQFTADVAAPLESPVTFVSEDLPTPAAAFETAEQVVPPQDLAAPRLGDPVPPASELSAAEPAPIAPPLDTFSANAESGTVTEQSVTAEFPPIQPDPAVVVSTPANTDDSQPSGA